MATFGEILAQILKYHCKIRYKISRLWHKHKHTVQMPVACCYLLEDSGWVLLVPDGIWIFAVIS